MVDLLIKIRIFGGRLILIKYQGQTVNPSELIGDLNLAAGLPLGEFGVQGLVLLNGAFQVTLDLLAGRPPEVQAVLPGVIHQKQ